MSNTLEISKQPKSTPLAKKVDKNAMNLAASWYIAMPSKDLGKKPKAIELFGQPLVAWRDGTGHPVIMERYCSHMGASLAIGQVVDGCIRCPYHHWRYDDSGKCVSIPEVDHVPPTARQATYVTVERYGYIWVWYGSVTPLFPLPEFPAAEDQRHNYMAWRYVYKTKTTVRQLTENIFDYYHAPTLHQQKVSGSIQFTLLDDPHSEPQNDSPIQREGWLGGLEEFSLFQPCFGLNAESMKQRIDAWPGGSIVTTFLDSEQTLKALLWTTPVAENKTIAHFLLMLKKRGNFWLDIPYYLVFGWQSKKLADEDVSIFNAIKPAASRAFTKHDRGILKFREFYQSWVDKVS